MTPQPIPDQLLVSSETDDRARVGETLPKVCHIEDVARLFGVAENTVSHWINAGKLDRFEITPQIGKRVFSGTLLQRFVDAEPGASRFVIRATARKRAS